MVGEELALATEDDNEHDEHAVAVMKDCWARAMFTVQGILVFLEAWWQNSMPHYRQEEAIGIGFRIG